MKYLDSIIDLYKTNEVFRTAVQVVEGGLASGFLSATVDGFDLSKDGVRHLGAALVAGVVIAVRNYFKNRASQLETKQ
jgi:pantothenate kinase type III